MGALISPPMERAHSPFVLMNIASDMTGSPAPLRRSRLDQLYQRDPRAEGRFWYSVVTTGVYCRPTCPSRHARPENIRLHDTLAEARATGFRPCLRCRPEAPALGDHHRRLIDDACRRIAANGAAPPSRELAAAAGLSPAHFYRLFRRLTGTTPTAYARSLNGGGASGGDRTRMTEVEGF
jgi:AraC family transcriptional regulator of adaptative response/methylated-DNA-[protein]-cysteine methyltransferase